MQQMVYLYLMVVAQFFLRLVYHGRALGACAGGQSQTYILNDGADFVYSFGGSDKLSLGRYGAAIYVRPGRAYMSALSIKEPHTGRLAWLAALAMVGPRKLK